MEESERGATRTLGNAKNLQGGATETLGNANNLQGGTTDVQVMSLQSENECDLSTTNLSFPPKDAAKLNNLSMVNNSTSVVKRELEVTNSDEETQSIPSPPADNTIINYLDILDTAAVQDPVVNSVQVPEVESAKKQKKSQKKDSSDK